jgi:phosphatidylglycerol:prolipoprotein diacylglycerol transferase
MEYNATTAKIFDMPPYFFFAVTGVVFASSVFMVLSLKYGYSVQRYTKIFFLSGIGLLIGAKLFGCLTGLYIALAGREPITLKTFTNTGIVCYGGIMGFIASFLLICKKWNKKLDYGAISAAVVCMPLFLFWGRIGCFTAGCCYGVETNSRLSVLYTTRDYSGEIITAQRVPIQLIEAVLNLGLFFGLLALLGNDKFKEKLLYVYLGAYAAARMILEFFRGDFARGMWGWVSFSQMISLLIIVCGVVLLIFKKFNLIAKNKYWGDGI